MVSNMGLGLLHSLFFIRATFVRTAKLRLVKKTKGCCTKKKDSVKNTENGWNFTGSDKK